LRRRPRKGFRPEVDKNAPRVNQQIRAPRVLVIDEKGNKLGEFLIEDAISLAKERGLDLIEVAPNSRPPVCKVADFGKMKYEKKKKEAASRKTQTTITVKEIKLRPKTDQHDFDVKLKHARRFLEKGDKVKVTVRFRGREMAHKEIGEQQSMRIAEACLDLATIEAHPRMDGRQMFLILAPKKV
jgi:translation initiation factor IF-3